MTYLREIFLGCLVLFLFGCSATSINSTNWAVLEPVPVLQERLSLWSGLTTERLYAQIGPPSETMEDQSGNDVLVYLKEILNPENKLWHCKVSFTINDSKEIIETRLLSRKENAWGAYMPCVHIIKEPVIL